MNRTDPLVLRTLGIHQALLERMQFALDRLEAENAKLQAHADYLQARLEEQGQAIDHVHNAVSHQQNAILAVHNEAAENKAAIQILITGYADDPFTGPGTNQVNGIIHPNILDPDQWRTWTDNNSN